MKKYSYSDINNIKTYLTIALNKINTTYESVEDPEQYGAVFNMCENLVDYCNAWIVKLKPLGLYKLNRKRKKIYNAFHDFAAWIVQQLNNLVDSHTAIEISMQEYTQKYKEIEERMRIEKSVLDMISKEKEEEIKKESKPIGFVIGQTKKKRKYTKKKNVDRKSTDTTSDSESTTRNE